MSVTVEDIVAALFWRATRSGPRIARAPTEPVNCTARVLVFDVLGSDHTDRGAWLRYPNIDRAICSRACYPHQHFNFGITASCLPPCTV